MSEHVVTFTDQNWDKEVIASGQPVLVDFFADWCMPCKAMAPDVEAVAKAYQGRLRVGKLNVDEQGETAMKYGITAMPTIIVLKNGQIDLVITTVSENRAQIHDSRSIRTTALAQRVTYYTTISGGRAAVEGMRHLQELAVYDLQGLHRTLTH